MIITVTSTEKTNVTKLLNDYADLAYQVMELTGEKSETEIRENALDSLKKDIEDSGAIEFLNESTIVVKEKEVLKMVEVFSKYVTLLQKLAPIVAPAIKEAIPIIEEFVEDLEKITNPPKSEFTCNDHDQHVGEKFNAESFIDHGKVERKN